MRREGTWVCLMAAALATAAIPAQASDETEIVLVEDAGRMKTQAACSMCHSLDYIVMNSPFQNRAGWEKTVRKMVHVMGALMTAEDEAAVVDYLTRHYGQEPAPKQQP